MNIVKLVGDIKVIALLPMKGHSERVPNKNLRNFCGRPLYHHIVDTLHQVRYVSLIVIDTDSQQIIDDAQKHFSGVKILNRPKEICGDFVPMNSVIAHDVKQTNGEHFLQTHSTNPLLTSETINNAIEKYFSDLQAFDSLFSVTKIQSRLYWENGDPLNHDPNELLRTQDLPLVYEENSNLYIFSRSSFLASGERRIGKKARMFVIDKIEAMDIDEEQDFSLAETLYQNYRTVEARK